MPAAALAAEEVFNETGKMAISTFEVVTGIEVEDVTGKVARVVVVAEVLLEVEGSLVVDIFEMGISVTALAFFVTETTVEAVETTWAEVEGNQSAISDTRIVDFSVTEFGASVEGTVV